MYILSRIRSCFNTKTALLIYKSKVRSIMQIFYTMRWTKPWRNFWPSKIVVRIAFRLTRLTNVDNYHVRNRLLQSMFIWTCQIHIMYINFHFQCSFYVSIDVKSLNILYQTTITKRLILGLICKTYTSVKVHNARSPSTANFSLGLTPPLMVILDITCDWTCQEIL